MQYSTLSLAICLAVSMIACKRPDPIRLQPTIEEPARFSSVVHIGDPSSGSQLLSGFYEVQNGRWCWVSPRFAVALENPPGAAQNGAWLVLNFTLPESSVDALKKITVAAKIGDLTLASETFTTPGEHTYRHEAPPSAFPTEYSGVTFTVDKFLKIPSDSRDLALVVTSIGLEDK